MHERVDDDIDRAGVLAEKTRRRLFTFVASRPGDVDRDEAAAAAGISRPLAAFHLDRLVQAGLLEATFRRPAGRGGPGAGRPAKRYRRSSYQLALTLPERRYELAAGLLAQALEDGPQAGRLPLLRAARSLGRDLGSAAIAPFMDVPARGDEGAAGAGMLPAAGTPVGVAAGTTVSPLPSGSWSRSDTLPRGWGQERSASATARSRGWCAVTSTSSAA